MHRTRVGFLAVGLVVGICSVATTTAFASRTPSAVSHAPVISPAKCAANRAAGPMTFVSPFGYDASAGIIDVFAAKSLGYFADLCVTVDISIPSFTLSPYELVSSGRGTVTGEGSAADDLAEVASGANLVAVSTFGDTSDYALLTSPNITNLRELAGKTLGYHTVVPVVISEMLQKAGVNLAAVHTVNDTSYDPRLLVENKFQALQAYQSNEPLELEADGYKLVKAFKEWKPSQFGVAGTFNVQIVNGSYLAADPATVADFMRAELKATAYCITHQTACVAIEQRAAGSANVTYNQAQELREWAFESSLITHDGLPGKGIGVESLAEWQPEASAVRSFGIVKHPIDLAKVENTTLVASLYRGKTLIWP